MSERQKGMCVPPYFRMSLVELDEAWGRVTCRDANLSALFHITSAHTRSASWSSVDIYLSNARFTFRKHGGWLTCNQFSPPLKNFPPYHFWDICVWHEVWFFWFCIKGRLTNGFCLIISDKIGWDVNERSSVAVKKYHNQGTLVV